LPFRNIPAHEVLVAYGLDVPDDGGGIALFLSRAGVTNGQALPTSARPIASQSDWPQPLEYASEDSYAVYMG
jgi:hypothetical protein